MRSNPQGKNIVDDGNYESPQNNLVSELNEFVQSHFKVVCDKFSVYRLKREYHIRDSYAMVCQMYVVTNSLMKSGLYAGYSKVTARQQAYRIVHIEECKNAIEVMRADTDPLIEERRLTITNKCVERLERVIETGTDRDAIAAVNVMQKFLDSPLRKKEEQKEEQKENNVVLDIQQELEQMGVYESGSSLDVTNVDEGTATITQ